LFLIEVLIVGLVKDIDSAGSTRASKALGVGDDSSDGVWRTRGRGVGGGG